MDFEQMMQAIASIGFPAAMCFYTMHVTGAKVDKLTDTVNELTKVVAALTGRLRDGEEEGK